MKRRSASILRSRALPRGSGCCGCFLLALGILLASPRPAGAHIGEVEVLPADPDATDRIVVRVSGEFPDTCWKLVRVDVKAAPGEVTIEVVAETSGEGCLEVLVPYSFDAKVGRLPPGGYTLSVVDPQETAESVFYVSSRGGLVLGDANSDGGADVADAVFVLLFLFAGGASPLCDRSADPNGDGRIDLSDPVHLLNHLFREGPRPSNLVVQCHLPEQCAAREWLVFCAGHWECDCGECKAVCELDSCGDGVCDFAAGETPASCPGDCQKADCRPVCGKIGTRSEGWYDPCGGTLIDDRWAFCADCIAVCRHCGSKSEGWYDFCTGELIAWADCDCEE